MKLSVQIDINFLPLPHMDRFHEGADLNGRFCRAHCLCIHVFVFVLLCPAKTQYIFFGHREGSRSMALYLDYLFMEVVWNFERDSNIIHCTMLKICGIIHFLKLGLTHVWDRPFVHKQMYRTA
jgi:hypothetical protein